MNDLQHAPASMFTNGNRNPSSRSSPSTAGTSSLFVCSAHTVHQCPPVHLQPCQPPLSPGKRGKRLRRKLILLLPNEHGKNWREPGPLNAPENWRVRTSRLPKIRTLLIAFAGSRLMATTLRFSNMVVMERRMASSGFSLSVPKPVCCLELLDRP
jgi:hypothetical protein